MLIAVILCLQMQNGGEVDTQQVDQLLTEKADLQVQLKQVSRGQLGVNQGLVGSVCHQSDLQNVSLLWLVYSAIQFSISF